MVVAEYRVKYTYGEEWKLKPIFDVHAGNKDCDLNEFKKFMADSDDKTLFIGGGDLIDAVITKDIKRYRKSADDTDGDAIIDEQIDIICEILRPYSHKIIGLGAGNHEDTILKYCGTNPTKRMCDILSDDKHKIQYLGYSCLVRLVFELKQGGAVRTIIIRQHHGWGGGSRTRGANITKYERDIGKWDADIFLYGHVHQKQFDRTPRLGLRGLLLVSRPQLMVICGSYLKTYSTDANPTYSEVKGFPPNEIGGVTIQMKPDSHRWIDLSAVL